MAEYKNGFNFRGNMSVDKEDYAPDVQTGRAVFVDEDKYTNDASYKAKVDKCVEEGFHRISEGDTPSGGGGGTSEVAVYHFKENEDNSTSELVAFIQENADKQVAVLDDEYGYMQTVVGCLPNIIATLSYDGADLRLYRYASDGQFPDTVTRGEIPITQ